jgi:hypothetical protein
VPRRGGRQGELRPGGRAARLSSGQEVPAAW